VVLQWCHSGVIVVSQWCYTYFLLHYVTFSPRLRYLKTGKAKVVSQSCFGGVTVVLQWCYNCVTVVSQWCYLPPALEVVEDRESEGRHTEQQGRVHTLVRIVPVVMVMVVVMVMMIII
jgi:hypothetical protein